MSRPYEEEWSASVVIVGSHRVVYAGIEVGLSNSHPRIKIIGHFASAADFVATQPTESRSPVVLFDMPCEDGGPDLDALRDICEAGHRVIVYTCLVEDDVVSAALEAGAVSCVARSEPEHELAAAIHAADSGRPHVGPRMARALHNDGKKARPQLSRRERQVLIAWFQTENKNAVAERLYIEPSTVATHLQRVRAKYAAVGRPAPTKAALVARAIQDDILSVNDL